MSFIYILYGIHILGDCLCLYIYPSQGSLPPKYFFLLFLPFSFFSLQKKISFLSIQLAFFIFIPENIFWILALQQDEILDFMKCS